MFKQAFKLSCLAATTLAAANSPQDHWAVIVVGSHGFMNYRHHADACHAYKQAVENGIPAEQIIVIAYDDVASCVSNPFRGKLFNKPSKQGETSVDVYEGCNIDYKSLDANKYTVLGVLKGDTSVGDKVLKSDQNSKVFFYFTDHGAPGLVAMPVGDYLFANELNQAFEYMHENKMFKEMVVYMEACESGSMFENILKKDIGIYAVSAANSKESSWGAYCYPDDLVEGTHIGSCLGDLFSVNWMEDLDGAMERKELGAESLQTQYESVKSKTQLSHVLQWGDVSLASEAIGEFEAGTYSSTKDRWAAWKNVKHAIFSGQLSQETYATQQRNDFAIPVRDINLHYFYSKVLNNPSEENQKALSDELAHRLAIDNIFESVFPQFIQETKRGEYPLPKTDEDFACYRDLINIYREACGDPDTYTMKYFGAFLNQCQFRFYQAARDQYKANIQAACKKA